MGLALMLEDDICPPSGARSGSRSPSASHRVLPRSASPKFVTPFAHPAPSASLLLGHMPTGMLPSSRPSSRGRLGRGPEVTNLGTLTLGGCCCIGLAMLL